MVVFDREEDGERMKRFIESKHSEYKRELSESFEKEVVAFLNSTEGGHLSIGIDAKTDTVTGVDDPDRVQLQIKDRIKNNIAPSVLGLFDVFPQSIDGKIVIKITLAGGPEKPYHLKKMGMSEKGCYIRIGSASEPMSSRMIEEFFAKRARNSIGLMRSPANDLSFEQLKIFYQASGFQLNEQFASTLELLTPQGEFNYAAYLLSDRNGISIKVAKYSGTCSAPDCLDII
jgi:predicted HTH transcriptional regulator